MLDQVKYVVDTLAPHIKGGFPLSCEMRDVEEGFLYCPECTTIRRMKITVYQSGMLIWQLMAQSLNDEWLKDLVSGTGTGEPSSDSEPSLLSYNCVQCDAHIAALVYWGPEGPAIATFPSKKGGISTPHTPAEVAYHLDQAYKCHIVSANTAAVSCFRVALEQLLDEQEYKTGMLDQKLRDLENDIQNKSGKPWTELLDVSFLRVIQRLGNKAVHPRRVARLAAYDSALVIRLQIAFQEILNLVYEKQHGDKELLAQLKALRKKVR